MEYNHDNCSLNWTKPNSHLYDPEFAERLNLGLGIVLFVTIVQ